MMYKYTKTSLCYRQKCSNLTDNSDVLVLGMKITGRCPNLTKLKLVHKDVT